MTITLTFSGESRDDLLSTIADFLGAEATEVEEVADAKPKRGRPRKSKTEAVETPYEVLSPEEAKTIPEVPEKEPEPEVTLLELQALFGVLIKSGEAAVAKVRDFLIEHKALNAEGLPKLSALDAKHYPAAKAFFEAAVAEIDQQTKGLL